jgi:hypothetical protein
MTWRGGQVQALRRRFGHLAGQVPSIPPASGVDRLFLTVA